MVKCRREERRRIRFESRSGKTESKKRSMFCVAVRRDVEEGSSLGREKSRRNRRHDRSLRTDGTRESPLENG